MEGIIEGRHLAAIMFVDMVGYSARMQQSEARAIASVRALWERVRPLLAEHGGREVDLAGDGMLTEFPGALAAVRCAQAIHQILHRANQLLPEAERVRTRTAVHLGDIEHRDGRIYGDGVNIAARLLPLAPAGGIVMSSHVRDQLLNVLEQGPQLLGTRTLKHIKQPLQIWCLPGPDGSSAELAAARAAAQDEAADRKWSFGAAVLDERTLELTVGGAAVELEKKALDVLTFLLHHAGEVVTKDEILEAVWPGRVLSETVLTKCISNVRAALQDAEQSQIKTVHGFGYRLAVPVTVEASANPTPPHFDFKEGDHPPLRPLWSLVRSLGRGGHGEVWLARHDKTREERVYKFALDPIHLASLKREITLSRVLHETPQRDRFVRVLDWNLEQLPYFIECDYSRHGSLVDWAGTQGGLEKIALATRLELAAQTAEAVANAHSVGVLHKDLKPSNVLVEQDGEQLRIRLCDFGSGGVLDPHRLEDLGITRMGFTRTVLDAADSTSGTPIYLAPEILAGQPWTSQADVYALGVMLYQLAVGDFRRTLAPGWEKDIPDELLREDIAAAAAGRAADRLADAALLGQRLRALPGRRGERERERVVQQELEHQRLALERLKARRTWVRATIGALAAGLLVSVGLTTYALKARLAATAAQKESEAVGHFLAYDLLAANPMYEKTDGVTLIQLLDQAVPLAERKLAEQPAAKAKIWLALGSSYWSLSEFAKAEQLLQRAAAEFESLYGRDDIRTLWSLSKLGDYWANNNKEDQALALLREAHAGFVRNSLDRHPYAFANRAALAIALGQVGQVDEAVNELEGLRRDSGDIEFDADAVLVDDDFRIGPPFYACNLLTNASRFAEAEKYCRQAEEEFGRSSFVQDPAARTFNVAIAKCVLAEPLIELGRYEEAEAALRHAEPILRNWVGENAAWTASARFLRGRLEFERGRHAEAHRIFEREWQISCPGAGCALSLPRMGANPYALALALQRLRRLDEAAAAMRLAVETFEKQYGRTVVLERAALADIYREQRQPARAWAALEPIEPIALARLGDRHATLADLRRVQGLLWSEERQYAKARPALQEALAIYALRHGQDHWRAHRARAELTRLPAQ